MACGPLEPDNTGSSPTPTLNNRTRTDMGSATQKDMGSSPGPVDQGNTQPDPSEPRFECVDQMCGEESEYCVIFFDVKHMPVRGECRNLAEKCRACTCIPDEAELCSSGEDRTCGIDGRALTATCKPPFEPDRQPIGSDCQTSQECEGDKCLGDGVAQSYCTRECTTRADCPPDENGSEWVCKDRVINMLCEDRSRLNM